MEYRRKYEKQVFRAGEEGAGEILELKATIVEDTNEVLVIKVEGQHTMSGMQTIYHRFKKGDYPLVPEVWSEEGKPLGSECHPSHELARDIVRERWKIPKDYESWEKFTWSEEEK